LSEIEISSIILNYGIAGIILIIFYRLMSSELKELRREIVKLNDEIDKLVFLLDKIIDKK